MYVEDLTLLATWKGLAGKLLVIQGGTLEMAGQPVLSGGLGLRCTVGPGAGTNE